MLLGQLVSCPYWDWRGFLSQVLDTALLVAELLEVSGSPALQSVPRSLRMAALPPASQLLYPVLGNTSQRSIPVSWLIHPAAHSVNLLLQPTVYFVKKLIFFQNTGSTTMAAVWIEKSCCWPAFRLLLLNSPTEQRHIKVSSDTPIWGTYYCIDKIVKNWRALKALSRTDIKKKAYKLGSEEVI